MTSSEETLKHVIDGFSVGTVVATIAGWLPAIAALFTVIWTAIRIWETRTVQGWMNRSKRETK